MKKLVLSLCLLGGVALVLGVAGLASAKNELPGESIDAFSVVAGLKGRCKSNAGSTCTYGPTVPCNDVQWKDHFIGSCSGSKHDTYDDSEAGTVDMTNSDCCRLSTYCYCTQSTPISSTWMCFAGIPPAGVVCPMLQTRNKCTQL